MLTQTFFTGERRKLNRSVAEPEADRVLIRPRRCGDVLNSVLLGRS